MKRCSRCGAENYDDSNFCPYCGARIIDSKTTHIRDKNLIERFKNASIFPKLIVIIIAVFVFLVALGWIGHIFFGMPLEAYTEGDSTYRQSQFDSFDIDGDGALSFSEVESLALFCSYDDRLDLFDEADKNDNGLLKGSEFDGYIHRVDKERNKLENQKKDDKSKSSSSSLPTVKLGKCPSCGSDASNMYDYYDEFNRPYYQCTVCGYWTYDESEFYDE